MKTSRETMELTSCAVFSCKNKFLPWTSLDRTYNGITYKMCSSVCVNRLMRAVRCSTTLKDKNISKYDFSKCGFIYGKGK